MSTTFDVYPLKKEIPTFREVIDLSTEKLNSFLKECKINFDAKIEVKLFSKENNNEQIIDLDSAAIWEDDFYAWFTVSSLRGGIDAYYWELNDEDAADYLEEVIDSLNYLEKTFNKSGETRKNLVERCFENRIEWHFRKSANQLCVTAVALGFIASSFAELTDGIIFSGDGGWDYQIFPATAEEFDKCYFRPEEIASDGLLRKGVKDCLEHLPFELN